MSSPALETRFPIDGTAPRASVIWPGLRSWVLLFGLWTLPGLISTGIIYVVKHESIVRAVMTQMPPWWFWAPATPLILALGRRFRFDRGQIASAIPVHVLAMLLFSFANLAVAVATCRMTSVHGCGTDPIAQAMWKLFSYYAELNAMTYFGVIAVGNWIDYQRRWRDSEINTARLETQLVQAQLEALRMQLHPHFLFNTLHAIAVLVRKGEQQQAVRMLAGVSDLLRIALDNVGRQHVRLEQELGFLDRYLDVERTRFQDRLSVTMDVDPAVLTAEVPNLLLQPIVENAIRHGIQKRAESGKVEIAAKRIGERLVVTIRDDGAGLPQEPTPTGGLGLKNVRSRLEQLYPANHRLEIVNAPGGGVLATIEIPFVPSR